MFIGKVFVKCRRKCEYQILVDRNDYNYFHFEHQRNRCDILYLDHAILSETRLGEAGVGLANVRAGVPCRLLLVAIQF